MLSFMRSLILGQPFRTQQEMLLIRLRMALDIASCQAPR